MILYHVKKCADQFIIFYKKNVVYIFLNKGQNFISYSFHGRSVRDRIGAFKLYDFACRKRRFHTCRLCRFYSDYFYFRIQHLSQRRNAGNKSASSDRNKNVINSRKFLNDFHCDRSLACCYIYVIKRMYKRISLFFCQLTRIGISIVIDISVQDHFRAVALCTVHFYKRCNRRHNDNCFTAKFFCGKGNALSVISRRCRDQSSASFFIR